MDSPASSSHFIHPHDPTSRLRSLKEGVAERVCGEGFSLRGVACGVLAERVERALEPGEEVGSFQCASALTTE